MYLVTYNFSWTRIRTPGMQMTHRGPAGLTGAGGGGFLRYYSDISKLGVKISIIRPEIVIYYSVY